MDGWGVQPTAHAARQTVSRWATAEDDPAAPLPTRAAPIPSHPKGLSDSTDGWNSITRDDGAAEVTAWIGEASEADPPSATSPSPIDAERERGAESVMARDAGRVQEMGVQEGWSGAAEEGRRDHGQQQVRVGHDRGSPPSDHPETYTSQAHPQQRSENARPLPQPQHNLPQNGDDAPRARRAPLPPQHIAFAQSGAAPVPRMFNNQPPRFGGNAQYGGQGGMPLYPQGGRGQFQQPPQQQRYDQQQQQHQHQQQYSQPPQFSQPPQYSQQQYSQPTQFFHPPPSSNYQEPPSMHAPVFQPSYQPPPAFQPLRSSTMLTASTPAFTPPVTHPQYPAPSYPPPPAADFSTIRLTPFTPPFQQATPAPLAVFSPPPVVGLSAQASEWEDWAGAPEAQVPVNLPPPFHPRQLSPVATAQLPIPTPIVSLPRASAVLPSPVLVRRLSPEIVKRALPPQQLPKSTEISPLVSPPQSTPPSSVHSAQSQTATIVATAGSAAPVVPVAPRVAMPDRNRGHTGGPTRAKMTEEQLNEKLAAMRISNQKTAAKAAAAEADKGAFDRVQAEETVLRARREAERRVEREAGRRAELEAAEYGRMAEVQAAAREVEKAAEAKVEKELRDAALQKAITAERDRNAAAKLRKVEGRQWDQEKLQKDGDESTSARPSSTSAPRESLGAPGNRAQERAARGGNPNRGKKASAGAGGGWGLPATPATPESAATPTSANQDAVTTAAAADWGSEPVVAPVASADEAWSSWNVSAPTPSTKEVPKDAAPVQASQGRGGGRGGNGSTRGTNPKSARGRSNDAARSTPPHLEGAAARVSLPSKPAAVESTPGWGEEKAASPAAVGATAEDPWASWSTDTPTTRWSDEPEDAPKGDPQPTGW